MSPHVQATLSRPTRPETEPQTLLEVLDRAAEGTGRMVVADSRSRDRCDELSWGDVRRRARVYAANLHTQGVRAGDNVLLLLPTDLDFVISFFALQMLGAVPVPAPPPAGMRISAGLDRIARIARSCRAKAVISQKPLRRVLGDLALRAPDLECVIDSSTLSASASPIERAWINPSSIAFLQYTSGSTRDPRGVKVSHRNAVENCRAITKVLAMSKEDVYAGWCPLFHDMGLIGQIFVPLYAGITTVVMSPAAFLLRPVRWLQLISDWRATLSTAPNFAYGMATSRVSDAEKEGLDLSRWRGAMVGAEMVKASTMDSFAEAFARCGFQRSSCLPVYGLAEATLVVSFPTLGEGLRVDRVDRTLLRQGIARPSRQGTEFVSVGGVVEGHQVRIVSDRGRPLMERQIGEILVRGPSVTAGYYADPKRTRAAFRRDWLRTGDLGYWADDRLYVTGRAKDLLVVRGANFYPEDLEAAAERVDGVRKGNVVAFSQPSEGRDTESVVLVAETRATRGAHGRLAQEIRASVLEHVGVQVDQIVLMPPGTLPKTSSGKRQRRLTQHLYGRGELAKRHPGLLFALRLGLRGLIGNLKLWLRSRRRSTALQLVPEANMDEITQS